MCCCRWFEPFVLRWLNENDDISLEQMRKAYERDKRDGVYAVLLFQTNHVIDYSTKQLSA